MKLLYDILKFNRQFVDNKDYLPYQTDDKYPEKRVVMFTCMDTRLVELSLKSLNLATGDVKVIKNAGAIITHPFGSIMRSLIVAVYSLKADEIIIMGHHDCGMNKVDASALVEKMRRRGITEDTLNTLKYSGIEVEKWLHGFDNVYDSVKHDVNTVVNHPLLPSNVPVHGLVIDPKTGKLDLVVDGYKAMKE